MCTMHIQIFSTFPRHLIHISYSRKPELARDTVRYKITNRVKFDMFLSRERNRTKRRRVEFAFTYKPSDIYRETIENMCPITIFLDLIFQYKRPQRYRCRQLKLLWLDCFGTDENEREKPLAKKRFTFKGGQKYLINLVIYSEQAVNNQFDSGLN